MPSPPGRSFRIERASKSVDRRVLCSSETSIGGFKIVKKLGHAPSRQQIGTPWEKGNDN